MRRYLALAILLSTSLLHAQGTPDVTLSGIIQGPNGLPISNSNISLTPTQPFYVAGNGPFCSGYIFQINGLVLNCGDTINLNALLPAAPTNGINIVWNYVRAFSKDSVSAALVGDGNSAHCLSGVGTWVTCSGGGGGGTPGGSFGQLQFNSAGTFGGFPCIWSSTGNILTCTSINFGSSPVPGIWSFVGATSTASTDTSTEFNVTIPAGNYHNAFSFYIDTFPILQGCNTGGASFIGEVYIGDFTCGALDNTTVSRAWAGTIHQAEAALTLYNSSTLETAPLLRLHVASTPSANFNAIVYCPFANATTGACSSSNYLFTVNGLGSIFGQSLVLGANPPSTCGGVGMVGCWATNGTTVALVPTANQGGIAFNLSAEQYLCTENNSASFPCLLKGPLTAGQVLDYNATTGIVNSRPRYNTALVSGATGEFAHDILACQTALSATGGTCDATAEPAGTTTENIALSASNIHYILPPVQITIGAGFTITLSGSNNTIDCGGGVQSCVLNFAPSGATNVLTLSGSNDRLADFLILGGRCGDVPCTASPSGLTPQTENDIDLTGSSNVIDNVQIQDAGHDAIQIAPLTSTTASSNTIKNSQLLRAGWQSIELNAGSSTAQILDTNIINDYVKDGNIIRVSNGAGSINISNSGGTTCNVDRTLVQGTTVEFTNPPSNVLDTAATGNFEGIQSQDNTCHTSYVGNTIENSNYESFVMGGTGGVETGNKCISGGLLGAGAGCYMFSFGNANQTVGDLVVSGNSATNLSAIEVGYLFAVQDEAATGTNTYQDIIFANNVGDGGTAGALVGFRWFRNASDALTLFNVKASNLTLTNAATPVQLTYGSGGSTSGAVLLDNGSFDPSPIYASGCSTGTPTISGSFHNFLLTIGTTPATTCTLTMPRAPTGWWANCSDITSKTNGGYLTQQISNTTTQVVIGGYNTSGSATAWNASDVIQCQAGQY